MMLQRGHQSFALSPHKISLCFLLYSAFQSPVLSLDKHEALVEYIYSKLMVNQIIDQLTIIYRLMKALKNTRWCN